MQEPFLAVPFQREFLERLTVKECAVGDIRGGIGMPDGGGATLLRIDGLGRRWVVAIPQQLS